MRRRFRAPRAGHHQPADQRDHYNKDNGEVRVEGETQNGSVILRVSDTGRGDFRRRFAARV